MHFINSGEKMKSRMSFRVSLAALAFGGLVGVSAQAQMTVSSTAFADGGTIPNPFTYSLAGQCSGNNWSPPLDIANIPAGTQTLAIRMIDTSAGDFLHWQAWDIPVPSGQTSVSLPYNAAASLPAGTQSNNDFGAAGYGGACPPAGTGAHNYVFTVYALTTAAGSPPDSAAWDDLPSASKGTLTGVRTNGDNVSWTPPGPQPGSNVAAVPTVSEWGLMLMGIVLAGATAVRIGRRKG